MVSSLHPPVGAGSHVHRLKQQTGPRSSLISNDLGSPNNSFPPANATTPASESATSPSTSSVLLSASNCKEEDGLVTSVPMIGGLKAESAPTLQQLHTLSTPLASSPLAKSYLSTEGLKDHFNQGTLIRRHQSYEHQPCGHLGHQPCEATLPSSGLRLSHSSGKPAASTSPVTPFDIVEVDGDVRDEISPRSDRSVDGISIPDPKFTPTSPSGGKCIFLVNVPSLKL